MLKKTPEGFTARELLPWLLAAGLFIAPGCRASDKKGPPPSTQEAPAPPSAQPAPAPADEGKVVKPDGPWDPNSMTPPPPPPIPEEYREGNKK